MNDDLMNTLANVPFFDEPMAPAIAKIAEPFQESTYTDANGVVRYNCDGSAVSSWKAHQPSKATPKSTSQMLTDIFRDAKAEQAAPAPKVGKPSVVLAPRAPGNPAPSGALMLRRHNNSWFAQRSETDEDGIPLNVVGTWKDRAKVVQALSKLAEEGKFPEGQCFTYHGNKPIVEIQSGVAVLLA